jgi:hypothetical protein
MKTIKKNLLQYRLIASVFALSVVAVIAIAVKANAGRPETNQPPPRQEATQQVRSPEMDGPAQIVRFTLYDVGLFPREVYVSPGAVALQLEDVTERSTGLVIQDASNQQVAELTRRAQRWRDQIRVRLTPGRYTVYEAAKPRNRAILIVDAEN